MAELTTVRGNILAEATEAVTQTRNMTHGDVRTMFEALAQSWSTRLNVCITPEQAALLLIDLKVVRAWYHPEHRDNWVDIAGYAACGGELATKS